MNAWLSLNPMNIVVAARVIRRFFKGEDAAEKNMQSLRRMAGDKAVEVMPESARNRSSVVE